MISFLFFLFAVEISGQNFIPLISGPSKVNVEFNGITTPIYEAEFLGTHTQPHPQVQVGPALITVDNAPPLITYNLQELMRIPRWTRYHEATACLGGNINLMNFTLLDQAGDPDFVNSPFIRQPLSVKTQVGGNLVGAGIGGGIGLFLGGPAGAVGGALLGGIVGGIIGGGDDDKTDYSKQIDDLYNKFDKLSGTLDRFAGMAQQAKDATVQLGKELASNVAAQNQQNIAFKQAMLISNNNIDLLKNSTAAQASAISLLAADVDQKVEALAGGTNLVIAALNQFTNVTDADFNDVYGVLRQLQNFTFAQNRQRIYDTESVRSLVEVVLAMVTGLAKKTQIRALSRAVFYNAFNLAKQNPNEIQFVGQDGLAPLDVSTVPSLIYEKYFVNYIQQSPTISGPIPLIVHNEITFYWEIESAIFEVKPALSLNRILTLIGPSTCTRPGLNETGFNPDIKCRIWVEVAQSSCFASSASFDWSTAEPVPPAFQSGALSSAYCNGAITFRPVLVFKDPQNFTNYFTNNLCNVALYNPLSDYQMIMFQSQRIAYIRQNIDECFTTLNDLDLLAAEQSSSTPLGLILSNLITMIPAFVSTTADLFTLVTGRIPSGVEYELTNFEFTPTYYQDQQKTIPIPLGLSETLECVTMKWLSISKGEPLPVYIATPLGTDFIQEVASVKTVDFTDPTHPVHFPVVDASSDVFLDPDALALLPSQLFIIGDFNDPDFVWDPQKNKIDTSELTFNREKTFCYIGMPPGTTTPITYEQWLALNFRLPFKATAGLFNVDATKFPKGVSIGFDGNLYPYCRSPNSLPVFNVTDTSFEDSAFIPPNSDLCETMKFFYTSVEPRGGGQVLLLRPRTYKQRIRVTFPSGEVTAVLGQSFCPDYIIRPLGPLGNQLSLTNNNNDTIQLKIILNSTFANCVSTKAVSLLSGETQTLDLETICPNATITIQRLLTIGNVFVPAGFTTCAIVPAHTVNEISASYQGIPADIDFSITFAKDQVLALADEATLALFAISQSLSRALATITGSNQVLIDAINNAQSAAESRRLPPIIWNFTVNATATSLIQPYLDIIEQNAKTYAESQSKLQNLFDLMDTLSAQQNATLQDIIATIITLQKLNFSELDFSFLRQRVEAGSGGGGGGGSWLDSVGGFLKTLFTLPWRLIDKFSDKVNSIISGFIYLAIAVGLFFLGYKMCCPNLCNKSPNQPQAQYYAPPPPPQPYVYQQMQQMQPMPITTSTPIPITTPSSSSSTTTAKPPSSSSSSSSSNKTINGFEYPFYGSNLT